jgi:hypothetical protein
MKKSWLFVLQETKIHTKGTKNPPFIIKIDVIFKLFFLIFCVCGSGVQETVLISWFVSDLKRGFELLLVFLRQKPAVGKRKNQKEGTERHPKTPHTFSGTGS